MKEASNNCQNCVICMQEMSFSPLPLMAYKWLMLPTYILAYSAFFTAIIAVDYVLVHIPMQTPTIGLRMNVEWSQICLCGTKNGLPPFHSHFKCFRMQCMCWFVNINVTNRQCTDGFWPQIYFTSLVLPLWGQERCLKQQNYSRNSTFQVSAIVFQLELNTLQKCTKLS